MQRCTARLENYYFHKSRNKGSRNDLFIKRSGNYAVIASKCSVESQIAAAGNLLDFVKRNGAAIIGDRIYAYDLLNYIKQDNQDCMAFKFCIGVEI